MATKLKGLLVDRVDLVDFGANYDKRTGDGAHIMLFKRAPQSADAHVFDRMVTFAKAQHCSADLIAKTEQVARTFDQVLAGRIAQKAIDQLWDLYYAFMEAARSIFESDEANKIGLLRDSALDFMNAFIGALPEAMDDAEIEKRIAKVGRKISASRMKQLCEMHDKLGSLLKEVQGDETMKLAEFAKSLGVTVADNATDAEIKTAIEAHYAKAHAPAVGDAVQKAIDEALVKERAAQAAELAKRDTEIEKAKADAKAERDARILKEFDEQARGEFAGLPLSMEKAEGKKTDAEIFKALSEKAPDEWARVSVMLKSSAEALRQSALFTEQGGGGAAAAGSALAQLSKLAEDLVKSGAEKTKEQAMTSIASNPQHADLYKRYVEESRG